MSFNIGNALGAIKSINPIKLDTGAITSSFTNAIQSEFAQLTDNAPAILKNALINTVNSQLTNVLSNVTSTGRNNSIVATSVGSKFAADPNPLNDYANYTYHIRFSMSNEIQSYDMINKSKPNTNTITKVIIAESGITAGFNIISLKTNAAASGNGVKRNMWATTDYELVINEPLGLTLLDKIYYSAKELGVINHLRCPYFLEIWFKGYDEAGNILADNLFYSINRVEIIEMNAVSTHVGTTYTISMINDGGYAEMNAVSTPWASTSIVASTLGEFINQLQLKWNYMGTNINHDGILRNHYKISMPPEWQSWTLRNPEVLKQSSRSAPMSAELQGSQTVVTISRGQSIESIIDFAVYLCQEAQQWIIGTGAVGYGAPSLNTHGLIRYVSVFPKVEIATATPIDPVTGDYIRNITYYLLPTESVRAYTDMQTVKDINTPTVKENKLRYMIANNRLAKKYEYIYTGHNTEVLKFDFNLSNLWTIYQPTWIQSNSYDQYTFGAVTDTNSVGFQQVKGILNRTILAPLGILQSLDSTLNNTINSIISPVNQIASNLIESEQKLISNINSKVNTASTAISKITSLISPSTSADTPVSFNFNNLLSTTVENLENRFTANLNLARFSNLINGQQSMQVGTTRFAEDAGPKALTMLPVVGQFDPMPTQQQARQNADQNKIASNQDPNTYSPGTGLVGSIISNVFSDDAFQNIELVIKGDPWWMPISNITQNAIAETIVSGATASATPTINANYLGGDNEILLEFRTGVIISEDTGLAVTDDSGADFFSGLYQVFNVTNMFNKGKFTQQLTCVRDVLTTDTPKNTGSTTTSRDRQDVSTTTPTVSRDRQ